MIAFKQKREERGTLEIKRLTPEDFNEVEEFFLSLGAVADTSELDDIEDIIEEELSLGAYVNGRLVGVLLGWVAGFNGAEFIDDENALYFEFDIKPEYDGEHIRHALLEKMEEIAKEEEFDFLLTELTEPLEKLKVNPSLEAKVLIDRDFYFLKLEDSVVAFKKFF
ncbi:MAG: GNAT family N-acetyltransferase [Candidatus Micrarchaeota archaeon]|nr:GNAT family N-acetyltransferase [Candidatus Micrarchaeota archaeon]